MTSADGLELAVLTGVGQAYSLTKLAWFMAQLSPQGQQLIEELAETAWQAERARPRKQTAPRQRPQEQVPGPEAAES